jgi:hypothetical protein
MSDVAGDGAALRANQAGQARGGGGRRKAPQRLAAGAEEGKRGGGDGSDEGGGGDDDERLRSRAAPARKSSRGKSARRSKGEAEPEAEAEDEALSREQELEERGADEGKGGPKAAAALPRKSSSPRVAKAAKGDVAACASAGSASAGRASAGSASAGSASAGSASQESELRAARKASKGGEPAPGAARSAMSEDRSKARPRARRHAFAEGDEAAPAPAPAPAPVAAAWAETAATPASAGAGAASTGTLLPWFPPSDTVHTEILLQGECKKLKRSVTFLGSMWNKRWLTVEKVSGTTNGVKSAWIRLTYYEDEHDLEFGFCSQESDMRNMTKISAFEDGHYKLKLEFKSEAEGLVLRFKKPRDHNYWASGLQALTGIVVEGCDSAKWPVGCGTKPVHMSQYGIDVATSTLFDCDTRPAL